jgi:hypothetical protein
VTVDAAGADEGLVSLDVVDDAIPRACLDAVGMIGEPENQWKY